jgi:2'-5' RNA ligase
MGLLTSLSSWIPGFRFTAASAGQSGAGDSTMLVATSDDDRGPLPSSAEKIAATYGSGVAGRLMFLPYIETTTKDTPEVRAAMRSMLKDPYVKAAWLSQVFAVASEEIQVHAHNPDDPASIEQADFIRDGIDRLPLGASGLMLSILLPLGPDGISVVEPVTEVETIGRWAGKWVPKAAKAKDVENLYILGDRFRNITGIRSIRTTELGVVDSEEFLITKYAALFEEPFGMAAFRASYQEYWMLDTIRKLRAIHHEKRSAGTIVAKYKQGDDKTTLEETLRKLKSSTWACVPESVQLEVLALSTASETDYAAFERDKITGVVVGITFAELQMLSGDVPGGRGNSETHQDTAMLGKWYLSKIAIETINRQWIPRYINWNFYGVQGYPRTSVGGIDQGEVAVEFANIKAAQELGFDGKEGRPALSRKYYARALGLQLADRNEPGDWLTVPAVQGGQPPVLPPAPPRMFAEDPLTDLRRSIQKMAEQLQEVSARLHGEFKEHEHPRGTDGKFISGADIEAAKSDPAKAAELRERVRPEDAVKLNTALGGDGKTEPAKPPGAFRRAAGFVMNSKVGRTAQAIEHTLAVVAHKTRDIAEQAAKNRNLDENQTDRLKRALAIGDFVGGWVAGGVATAVAGPLAGKVVSLTMPSVSAAYLAYSTARNPKATWAAARKVVSESNLSPKAALGNIAAAWSGKRADHAEFDIPTTLANLFAGVSEEEGEFRLAVYLAGIQAGASPQDAIQLAAGVEMPEIGNTEPDESDLGLPGDRSPVVTYHAEPVSDKFALPGDDGERATDLLQSVQQAGVQTLHALTAKAVQRLLGSPNPLAETTLFNDEELEQLRDSLSSAATAGDLLGRSRIRCMADNCEGGVSAFAEPSDPAPYGYCPECREACTATERRPNGNTHCLNGHVFPAKKAKYASTQIQLKGPLADRMISFANSISDSDLGEDGREDDPHVTVRYGLHADSPDDVRDAIAGFGRVKIRVGKISAFYGSETGKPYDVIFAEIDSPDIHRLHNRLGDLPHTDTWPEYHPHATIAYVKAGLADRYISQFGKIDGEFVADQITFSTAKREQTTLSLAGVSTFAEPPATFARFADPIPSLLPRAAIEYFRSLVPRLSADPERFPPLMARHAFTLAHAADQVLLGKVKQVIADALSGQDGGVDIRGTEAVQQILDEAGVSPRSPQYAELVYRTNVLDSYNAGVHAELQQPDMQEMFPAWEYLGIPDGREGEDHRPKFGRYYPASATFAEVRGERVFNCRCSSRPVSKFEWGRLQQRGAVLESSW